MGNKLKNSFILIALLIFGSNSLTFAQEPNAWDKFHFEKADAIKYFSQERCYHSKQEFIGCISAIDSIFKIAGLPYSLTNGREPDQDTFQETVLQQQYLAVKKKNSGYYEQLLNDLSKNWSKITAVRNANLKSWEDTYDLRQVLLPINFAELINNSFDLAKPESSSATFANMINTFYSIVYDPHTYIRDIESLNKLSASEDSFVGIGANIQKQGSAYVLSPIEGGAAIQAGIRHHDVLTKVDDKDISSFSLEELVKMLRGQEGTRVHLTLLRSGQLVELDVNRAKVIIPKIEGSIFNEGNQKIGVIRLRDFMERGLCKKFYNLATSLQKQGANALVLDLRDNGGGLVNEALCMTSLYAPPNQILISLQDPYTNETKDMTTNTPGLLGGLDNSKVLPEALFRLYKKPLIVLVNAYSASASELLSGALQDFNRAVVVGVQTYGKGTMQSPVSWKKADPTAPQSIPDDEILLYRTVARFHFNSGRSNQLVGITPEFEVYSSPHPTEQEKFAIREKDTYTNAISAQDIPRTPDVKTVGTIHQCLSLKNDLEKRYKDSQGGVLAPDYQLLYAREVASCL